MTETGNEKCDRRRQSPVREATSELTLVGKCEPEPAALRAAAERGFDAVELYLERAHLDDFETTVAAVRDGPVAVATVHTPHVTPDETGYYELADDLAVALDAYLVLHSKYVLHAFAPEIEAIGFDAPHGHENNTGASVMHLEEMILAEETDLVLDTAHLYTAERDYQSALQYLFKTYSGRIGAVHLNDGTRRKDGLPFGAGDIDLRATVETIRESAFTGPVVLEVSQDAQAIARETVASY